MTIDATIPRLVLGAAAGAAAFLLLSGARLPRARPRPLGRAAVVRWITLGATAGVEEVVWRGLVLGGLIVSIGTALALVVSSAGFAVWHWPWLGGRSAVHLVTGTAFGTAFLAGGLAAAILGHALYNILVDFAVHAERARLRGP